MSGGRSLSSEVHAVVRDVKSLYTELKDAINTELSYNVV